MVVSEVALGCRVSNWDNNPINKIQRRWMRWRTINYRNLWDSTTSRGWKLFGGEFNFGVEVVWSRKRFRGESDFRVEVIMGQKRFGVESMYWHSEGVCEVRWANCNTMNMDMRGTIHHSTSNPSRGKEGAAHKNLNIVIFIAPHIHCNFARFS